MVNKFAVVGVVAVMLQSVSPVQAQQVNNKGATTGDIISYMILGAAVAATVWYLWPAAAATEVAAARVGAGAAGMGGGAGAPLVAGAGAGAGAGVAGAHLVRAAALP